MAKGDWVQVTYAGANGPEKLSVTAGQNGRKITLERTKTDVEITETTRGGTVVRTVWFPLSVVLAIDSAIREE